MPPLSLNVGNYKFKFGKLDIKVSHLKSIQHYYEFIFTSPPRLQVSPSYLLQLLDVLFHIINVFVPTREISKVKTYML